MMMVHYDDDGDDEVDENEVMTTMKWTKKNK